MAWTKGFHCSAVQIPLNIVKSVSYLQRLAAGICQWHWVSVPAQQHSFPWALHQLICSAPLRKVKEVLAKTNICLHTFTKSTSKPSPAICFTYLNEKHFKKKYAQHQTAIFVMMTSLCLPWTNHLHKTKFYLKTQAHILQENWKVWRIISPKFKTIVGITTENKQKY